VSLPETFFDYESRLLRCAHGERAALRELYEQEAPRLLGVALRLAGDRALAEDIVHDAFLKIWAGAGGFDPARGSARGWMFSITRHLALNLIRRNGRDVALDEDNEALRETPSPTDEHDGPLQAGRLFTCLDQLEPARRECIVLAYVDGYTHAQLAERLGTPLGTVKAWIKRSLAALRECMG
jgi:RNA polymerase sigma-70 factor (ECF subfamily)